MKKPAAHGAQAGAPQTDLAEGELEVVDESLRAHERKGDAQSGKAQGKQAEKKH